MFIANENNELNEVVELTDDFIQSMRELAQDYGFGEQIQGTEDE